MVMILMTNCNQKITKIQRDVRFGNFFTRYGKVRQIVGMIIEVSGLESSIGDVCKITIGNGKTAIAEVVGFKKNITQLMPYEDIDGIGYGNLVFNTGKKLQIKISEGLIGRTVDALAKPIDGKGEIIGNTYYSINGKPSNPMTRPPISEPIELGVKVIDGMITLGKGQRIGIFAGSGVGKSTLMGMIARNVTADVNVIALVGERGRELMEFIHKDLGEEGLKRSVVVVATSDNSAMLRNKCALTATAIAEYFKDKGKAVLLMMDSLTRYCMAQREIGLSTGEPPVARGYPPSIYASLPKLLERCGNFDNGSITGIYTVLVEGDDTNEPVADTVRGIIDGHIILSRKIAMTNHYPAIDVLASLSRLMSSVATSEQKSLAGKIRNIMSVYNTNQDLISIGAYKAGSNPELDNAIKKIGKINDFLKQDVDAKFTFEQTIDIMRNVINE